ncbi:hypothetical protein NXS19_001656 [Fusarium pseudograminearum]|nr:hypothetical protein NXS19_001656 [Fusarium pseudograminearum]
MERLPMQLSTKQTVYLRRQELAVTVIHCYIKLLPSSTLVPILSTPFATLRHFYAGVPTIRATTVQKSSFLHKATKENLEARSVSPSWHGEISSRYYQELPRVRIIDNVVFIKKKLSEP